MKSFSNSALLSSPFRPFFMATALISALVPLIWTQLYSGNLEFNFNFSSALEWHIHEMLYGFNWALLAGFLLTASSNWTGRPAINGTKLLAITLLWITARVLVFSAIPFWLNSSINIILSLSIVLCFWKNVKGNRNQFIILPIVIALFLSQVMFLLASIYEQYELYNWSLNIAKASLFHIIVIMAGRLVPMFTRNTINEDIRPTTKVNNILAIAPIAFMYLPEDMINIYIPVTAYTLASVVHLRRSYQWKFYKTFSAPLVFILHIGQLFIALYFLANILFLFGAATSSLCTHLFSVGVLGCFTIGMLQRVSKGHTGQGFNLSQFDKLSFVCILLAFFFRVPATVILDDYTENLYAISAGFWTIGFLLYIACYFRILHSPRKG